MFNTTTPTPSKSLRRLTSKAIAEYNMIREGDRILLGLSGGKDSLSLLHILRYLQRHAPVRFDLGVVTVDPQSDSFDPAPLHPYITGLKLDHYLIQEPVVELAKTHMRGKSYCSWCARMRRGLMYKTAREHDYNVLALAQHLDDLAESFLMSAFHTGRLKTMKAHYITDAGDLRVIRPLVYVRERQLEAFARQNKLPIIFENCPACFETPMQRQYFKALLAREEIQNKQLFASLRTTLRPIMTHDIEYNR